MPHYHQGKFTPKNPQKYFGDPTNIIFRSGWERKLFIWLDTNPNVLKWGSEEIFVMYKSPVDQRPHRYFPDIIAMMKTKTGEVVKFMIEVKPKKQTQPPTKPKKVTKRYLEEIETYAVNLAKWEAAKEYCNEKNFVFKILTEDHLGL